MVHHSHLTRCLWAANNRRWTRLLPDGMSPSYSVFNRFCCCWENGNFLAQPIGLDVISTLNWPLFPPGMSWKCNEAAIWYRMTASANWLDQKLMSASAHIVIIRVVSHDDIHHFSDESPWPKPFGINKRQSKEDECVSTKRITHNILFRETCFLCVPFVVVVALVVSGGDGCSEYKLSHKFHMQKW